MSLTGAQTLMGLQNNNNNNRIPIQEMSITIRGHINFTQPKDQIRFVVFYMWLAMNVTPGEVKEGDITYNDLRNESGRCMDEASAESLL